MNTAKIGMPTLVEISDLMPAVKLCKELGLSFIELNMNIAEFCPEKLPAESITNIMAPFDVLLKLAQEKGVTLCVENSGNFHLPFIKGVIDKLGGADKILDLE